MHPTYDDMFAHVAQTLADYDARSAQTAEPYRKRMEHTRRVYMWLERLLTAEADLGAMDAHALRAATIFHDAGYARVTDNADAHAQFSVQIFNEYAAAHGFDPQLQACIAGLIARHSDKQLLNAPDTPMELVLLMEADLLDETGALSIARDCMAQGREEQPSYAGAYQSAAEQFAREGNQNPMATRQARAIWDAKQALASEFIRQLARDIGVGQ